MNISEKAQWENNVSMLTRLDKVEGGREGAANIQAKQLGNRTQYLKQTVEAYSTLIKSGELPYSNQDAAKAAIVAGKIPEGALFSVRSEDSGVWVEEFKNVNGEPVATGKRLPDSQGVSIVVFTSAEDPTGTSAGLSMTVPGQTFRVAYDNSATETVYRNNGSNAVKLFEVADKRAMEQLLPDAGIMGEIDPGYVVEFVDEFFRRAVGIDLRGVLEANAGMRIMGVPVTNLADDSDYCFAFSDELGRIVFGIGKTGFIEVMGMRIFVTEGENFLEIIDENQRVSAGIGSKGEIFNNSAVEPPPVEPERFWLDFAEVLHVIIYGQSLSIGQYGTPVLNTPTRNALMFNTGVRSYSSSPASLVPLRESVSGSNGETVASSLAYGFTDNVSDMAGRDLLFNAGGVGGITVEGLSKGTEPYRRLIAHLVWTAAQMALQGREYAVDFILWIQGEANMANGTSADSYTGRVSTLRADVAADTMGMRDAGRDLVMLMYQTSSHGYYVGTAENPPEAIAQAQLDMALNDPLIDMWGPSYMGLPANHTIGQGNVHHNAHGYRLMGLYAQKALRHRLRTRTADKPDGEKYLPVHATRARKINSRTVITDVFTYHPPLVIDDSYITELADGNHGVELHDETGRLDIASVEIVAGTKIKIVSKTDIGNGAFVAFAWTPDNRGEITSNRYQQWFFGRETGVRTTIHDSDQEKTDLTDENGIPYPLYNYLPIQKIAISE
ncbi:sialate O-acetylesterase [Klebsiella aerogenes]|uniref:sialate O-acetylesterase n=1 Tax=Klebsiella aerogenes TaxID=548 RepID=UPI003A4D390B